MKLSIDTLIIGAGYAGLLQQKKLDSIGISNFIVDQGSSIRFADKDYIIVFSNKNDYVTDKKIDFETKRISSGSKPFDVEYQQKLYNKEIKFEVWAEKEEISKVYQIDNTLLTANSRVYGNVKIEKIDCKEHCVYGHVAHVGKSAIIKYRMLASTIPIYEFAKLLPTPIDLLDNWNIFIQFYPIGIIKQPRLESDYSKIIVNYYSNPLIPFYRTYTYGASIYYEYCINKPFNDINFHKVIGPGKFTKINPEIMRKFYGHFAQYDVHFVGRFARWDPDYRLDSIFGEKNDQ